MQAKLLGPTLEVQRTIEFNSRFRWNSGEEGLKVELEKEAETKTLSRLVRVQGWNTVTPLMSGPVS